MPSRHAEYLATRILNESGIVTYRMLSRALKVHSNAAKEMLYDFYTSQNARKPSTIHATYLLTGLQKKNEYSPTNGMRFQDEDSFMQDVGFMSSLPEQEPEACESASITVTSVILVAEEHLDELKSVFKHITGIHIYSLEPGPLPNIQLISDCNRRIAAEHASEDLMDTWKEYGTIHDPNAKRRKTRVPRPAPSKAPIAAAAKEIAITAKAADAKSDTKQAAEPASKSTTSKLATSKPAPLRRDDSSLFKSFAKTKPPTETKSASASNSAAPSDDEEMVDDHAPAPKPTFRTKPRPNPERELAAEAKIREMMELDESEPEPTADVEMAGDFELDPEPTEDAALDSAPAPPEQTEQVTVSDGRRRGRRRVMKIRTTKDAEGYLVTKEEAAWESFSEDESVPKKAKVEVAKSTVPAKNKGGKTEKKGQGSIMNFFGKKG